MTTFSSAGLGPPSVAAPWEICKAQQFSKCLAQTCLTSSCEWTNCVYTSLLHDHANVYVHVYVHVHLQVLVQVSNTEQQWLFTTTSRTPGGYNPNSFTLTLISEPYNLGRLLNIITSCLGASSSKRTKTLNPECRDTAFEADTSEP